MAITRHFCKMMGGTVLVESEAGNGSTFIMKQPAVVEESPGTPATEWLAVFQFCSRFFWIVPA
jgi:signal transduction histidine kinase